MANDSRNKAIHAKKEPSHKKFMSGLGIGGLNPYYKGSKDYRKTMKELKKK